MKPALISLIIALAPFSAAQSAAPRPSNFSVPVFSSGCPVPMKLQQTLGHQLQTVQNGKVIKAPATQLTLTIGLGQGRSFGYGVAGMEGLNGEVQPLAPVKPRIVASATATVHGAGTHPHPELLSPGANKRGGWSGPMRSVNLQFNSKDGQTAAQLWLPSFGAVRWLELDSVTYTDGTTWKPAQGTTCAIRPELLMLVGAQPGANGGGQ